MLKENEMPYEELDALSLEYKRDYGTARRNLNISDIVNNPNALGVIRVLADRIQEAGHPGVQVE